jgi:hypothetical protein
MLLKLCLQNSLDIFQTSTKTANVLFFNLEKNYKGNIDYNRAYDSEQKKGCKFILEI